VDRQPNDHLGRSRYGYGWEILRAIWSDIDSNSHSHSESSSNPDAYCNSNANTYTDAKSYSHIAAWPNFDVATHSAPSFNTAAYCFTERHSGTAAHSASSPHTAADAYRFATSNSGTSTVAEEQMGRGHRTRLQLCPRFGQFACLFMLKDRRGRDLG